MRTQSRERGSRFSFPLFGSVPAGMLSDAYRQKRGIFAIFLHYLLYIHITSKNMRYDGNGMRCVAGVCLSNACATACQCIICRNVDDRGYSRAAGRSRVCEVLCTACRYGISYVLHADEKSDGCGRCDAGRFFAGDAATAALVRAWLLVTASNLCKNAMHHWSRTKREEVEDWEATLGTTASPDEVSAVMSAVMGLPDQYKTVVYLFYYEGYSGAEIAGMLGKKESTVRSLLHRGKKILLKKLGGEPYAETGR